jgi:ParB-like chromosome segregation protein Spo0J
MDIISVKIQDLNEDPSNARKHPDKNLRAIKGSLAKFGQQKPIVIDSRNIVIAGNGTLQAARDLGWKVIDCVVTELDDLGKMAFALADNKTAELAEWDDDILQEQLDWLNDQDLDVKSLGFLDNDAKEMDLPDLNSGDKDPFESMTFIIGTNQATIIRDAIAEAIKAGLSSSDENENKNGNALFHICQRFLNG